jgi:hypothetical protein
LFEFSFTYPMLQGSGLMRRLEVFTKHSEH